jgi:hypothetical protein
MIIGLRPHLSDRWPPVIEASPVANCAVIGIKCYAADEKPKGDVLEKESGCASGNAIKA